MSPNPRSLSSLLLLLPVVSLGACAELGRGDAYPEVVDAFETVDAGSDTAPMTDATTTSGDAVEETAPDEVSGPQSFADGVHDNIVRRCGSIGCHGDGAGGFSIFGDIEADYEAVLEHVVPGDAQSSALILKGTNSVNHGGGQVWSVGSPEYELIVTWIDDGANP